MAWFGDFLDWYHNNGLLPGLWKGVTGQLSQEKIADENLGYQRERNATEDARYKEETAYNRAFAEDERDYNRALQQQIFEREDTAIERQADQLSSIGINPLSQTMNGLGSGSVVSAPTAPSASIRGGQALQNNMQTLDSLLPLVQFAGDLQSSIDGVMTGSMQRDSLRLENDKKFIENKILAHKNGISYYDTKYHKNIGIDGTLGVPFDDAFGSEIFKDADSVRDIKHKFKSGIFASDTELMKTLKDFSTEDYVGMAEKVVTNLSNIFNKLNFLGIKK